MLHLAVLGSTRGTDLEVILQAIKNKQLDATIDIVISNKADAYILERAKKYGVQTKYIDSTDQSREEYDHKVLRELTQYPIDLILLIGYMRILSGEFVRLYPHKIVNVHPSLLPLFAGGMDANVHEKVLKSGVKETGCTIHYVDEGIDTGEIIMQKKCLIDDNETVESLKNKVQTLEGEAFIEFLKNYEHH